MWKNVKALEEENSRLRQQREEWVDKALALSKRLYEERKCNTEALSQLGEALSRLQAKQESYK